MAELKEDLTKKLERKMQATYSINKVVENHYYIKNNNTNVTHDVTLVVLGEGRAELSGLPNQLNAFIFNFTEKDIYEDTRDVINVLITMYDSKGDGQQNLINKMPTEVEFSV